jgi:SAM-dependent methyltransferase
VEATAQTFWLENLKSASNYNSWIFSQFRSWLGDTVLEVGCGNGNFSEMLAQSCRKLVALDLDQGYVELTRRRLSACPHVEVLRADATRLDSPHPFDSIVMLDVLEHIEDDVATLKQLSKHLKPGGHLILKVPALESLYSPMDEVIGHYRRYRKATLQQTCEQAGFYQSRLWYFNLAGIPGWWLNGCVLKHSTPPSHQVGLFDRVVPLLQWGESQVKPPVGLSLFAIAPKL